MIAGRPTNALIFDFKCEQPQGRPLRSLILSVRKPGVEENAEVVDDLSSIDFANVRYSAGSPRMRKQKLLQRLFAALATNESEQPKRTEIWQRLKSLTPREVDVLCYVLGGQLNREIAVECNRLVKHRVDSRDGGFSPRGVS